MWKWFQHSGYASSLAVFPGQLERGQGLAESSALQSGFASGEVPGSGARVGLSGTVARGSDKFSVCQAGAL